MPFLETNYEQAVVSLLELQGYKPLYGPEVERDYRQPFWEAQLRQSLEDVNPGITAAMTNEVLRQLESNSLGTLVQRNMRFTDWLQHGMDISYEHRGEIRYAHINLVDYDDVEANTFHVANQWTYVEREERRPDIIVFVNGLPLVVMELKSPSDENTSVDDAWWQLKNYMTNTIPGMFVYNAFCVVSDMATTKAGTITAPLERYMEWKSTDGRYESTAAADYDTFFEGIFPRERLLDLLRNYTCFSETQEATTKILAGYHQYFAVEKAAEKAREAVKGDGKIGVFWHTQGSGKSLSMVFFAHRLQQELEAPTIVVITDRNDLDDQLYQQFCNCKNFLRQTPEQADSREDLRQKLVDRQANGIIFTTMQKFQVSAEPLSTRRNIVVMSDEAHRSNYGFEERVDAQTGKVSIGTARIIHDSLPNASFIGFTGTPISHKDKNTREVFGDYIDIYDMTQSVADGATLPIYYESRVVNIGLNDEILEMIDHEYDRLADAGADSEAIEKSKHEQSHTEALLGAPETIDSVCRDIISHYEDCRQQVLTGKAMVVAYSRAIAMKMYYRFLELRPAWKEKIAVVMTTSNQDPVEWGSVVGGHNYKVEMGKRFKDNKDPLKIAIVVDMWLTGFDVPSLATMYVIKPMKDYNLMQAIARVNRVFPEKAGGLVVDYIGLASALRQAMHDYTRRDQENYGDRDVRTTALAQFHEKLEVCRALLHGYDHTGFDASDDAHRATLIKGGANYLLDPRRSHEMEDFMKQAYLLKQSLTLCRSLVGSTERWEQAFYESVRIMLVRTTATGKISKAEINRTISDLLRQSVKSEGVINLFKDNGEVFSLADEKFLEDISHMKEKNLAVELLKKLIAERMKGIRRQNVVQSQKFSEMMSMTLSNYLKGMLTNEEVIRDLIEMAQQMMADDAEADRLGLTPTEKAFYDAIARPQAVRDFYSNDELVAMTRELTELLRRNRSIDWQQREQARAGMRKMVKRLLKKYDYPPEEARDAIDIVLQQCEQWTDNEPDDEDTDATYPTIGRYPTADATRYGEDSEGETLMAAESPSPYGE